MKKILILLLIGMMILSGCSLGEKRYVEENKNSFKDLPVKTDVYKATLIKELATLSAAADLIKMSHIQVGLGNRNYQEDIERVEEHIKDIQEVRDLFENMIEPMDMKEHKADFLEALDEYSVSVNAYLSLLKKDSVTKDELDKAVDDLYLKFKFAKEFINA